MNVTPASTEVCFALLQLLSLVLVAVGGVAVVFTRHPLLQVFAAGLQALFLVAFLLVMQAPDVAMSEIVVGVFASPAFVCLALAKTTGGRAP
jgi:energy-converting hydrogenase B subunit D